MLRSDSEMIVHIDGSTHPNTDAFCRNCDLCGPDPSTEEYDEEIYDDHYDYPTGDEKE